MPFDLVTAGFAEPGYTPGMKPNQPFSQPKQFAFPTRSLWSTRISKYTENRIGDRVDSVNIELIEDNRTVFTRTITELEYRNTTTYSPTPKLIWAEFTKVLKVFMNADRQERDSDIDDAFRILDQQAQGLYGRALSLPDGFISPDEFRVFLEILSYQWYIDVCIRLADTNHSGQISRLEFNQMIRSGLARDIVCGRA